ncbi:Nuclear protein Hcc-1 [Trichostrongylus colubriformis]|uniref:Nuclear protein Hcc-1 n=1 Tax=Trichostrongylus colubriformis TaxID=6319 RepID=A0AAN8FV16_TRICO
MNSEADYQKMTIAHLKEELTKRGITADPKAKKSELIKLLQKAEEDAILNHSEDGGYGDPLSTPDEDLLNDDVLNDVLPEKLIDEVSEPSKATEEAKSPTSPDVKSEKPKPVAITPPHDPLALDAKLKRAQRFGLPVGVTDPLAKAKRAERFGLASVSSEKEMKAKRAERFGLTGRTSPGARISTITDEETKKKLLIRAQRFGLPVNEQGKTVNAKDPVKAPLKQVGPKTGAANDEVEQKKRARMERFGLK